VIYIILVSFYYCQKAIKGIVILGKTQALAKEELALNN